MAVEAWRAQIVIPAARIETTFFTDEPSRALIREASQKRRIAQGDFIGRAALSFAAYDLDLTWPFVTREEHAITDLRLGRYTRRNYFGREFGHWQIEGLS
jgi:hypothetical protein